MSTVPKIERVPRLESGDRLTADEFRRRYAAMPNVRKAELIDGVVFMPSPVRWQAHSAPHMDLGWILTTYRAYTPGTDTADNPTVKLDLNNEPQPDAALIIRPEFGGQAEIDADDYLTGGPELVAEVSASSAALDRNRKFELYRRHRVREYIIWRPEDEVLDWFVLRRGRFAPLAPDPADGLLKSHTFPGLWLDAAALARRDLMAVLAALTRGVQSPEHAAFVKKLAAARA